MKKIILISVSVISISIIAAGSWQFITRAKQTPTVEASSAKYAASPAKFSAAMDTTTRSAHPSTAVIKHTSEKIANIANINVSKLMTAASSEGLKPKVLKAALNAYNWALKNGKLGNNKDTLTVVDFTLPSYEKRMWVLNLHQNKVLMKLHTTQGSGSGLLYANRFSNVGRSQASSLGLYRTSEQYHGKHGKSMRLDGLQNGINSNARHRAIVIHEAAYATPEYIKRNHRAGRSWGCFAVAPSSKNKLLGYVNGGSAFFAYARAIEKSSIINNGPISI